jgi:NADH-ubiquinone oxidoreductase chain 1
MTEHGASIFVFFFLGEYSSLILMSTFMSIFFLGGHHCPDLHKLIMEPIFVFNHYINNLSNYWYLSFSDNINNFYNSYFGYRLNDNDIKILWDEINLSENHNELEKVYYYGNINSTEIGTLSFNDYFIPFTSKDAIFESINIFIDKVQGSYILGFKIIIVVFFFIWVRASFPRLRYDQLMSLCWKELLPLVFAYIIFTICLFYTFDMMPFGTAF